MTTVDGVRRQLQQFTQKFARARQYLAKVDLSFFNNSTDQSNLIIAKNLTQRGQRSCWLLFSQFNRVVGNLNVTEVNQLDQALLHGPPTDQWNLTYVFGLVSQIAQFGASQVLDRGLLQIPMILSNACNNKALFSNLFGLAVGIVTIGVISWTRSNNNKQTIERYLRIQGFVESLQRCLRNLQLN